MHVTVAMQSSRAKAGDFSTETKRYDRSWAANELVGTRGGPLRSLIKASCVLRPEQAQNADRRGPLAHWLHTRKHCATAVELDKYACCALPRTDIDLLQPPNLSVDGARPAKLS